MSIIVVGSTAFDDIETPKGKRKRIIGGSCIYFSLDGIVIKSLGRRGRNKASLLAVYIVQVAPGTIKLSQK